MERKGEGIPDEAMREGRGRVSVATKEAGGYQLSQPVRAQRKVQAWRQQQKTRLEIMRVLYAQARLRGSNLICGSKEPLRASEQD